MLLFSILGQLERRMLCFERMPGFVFELYIMRECAVQPVDVSVLAKPFNDTL